MKRQILLASIVLFMYSCSSNTDKSASSTTDTTKMADSKMAASTEKIDYPFTLDHPYNDWQVGDPHHAVTAMSALKGYVDNNIPASVANFGDSVRLRFDYMDKKVSRDSLAAMFTRWRANTGNITIKMDDWESVIAKDKSEEWVTLWYKQLTTDKNGVTDSMSVTDDCKIVNGKIVILDESIRHYPKKGG